VDRGLQYLPEIQAIEAAIGVRRADCRGHYANGARHGDAVHIWPGQNGDRTKLLEWQRTEPNENL
jgi:hypothetical protein